MQRRKPETPELKVIGIDVNDNSGQTNLIKKSFTRSQIGINAASRNEKRLERRKKYLNAIESIDFKATILKDMKHRKMSRVEYADLFRLSSTTIQSWVKGKSKPNVYILKLIRLKTSEIEEFFDSL
jgi:DNA-binding transcriptional regulator YiaG